jgi:hypothetical protein
VYVQCDEALGQGRHNPPLLGYDSAKIAQ